VKHQDTGFNVVFEGRYVAGRDPVVAQAAFAKQFGDSIAVQVFNQERTVLKRDVTHEAGQQMQGVLSDVGMLVSLLPATESKPRRRRKSGNLSIVERAGERSRARTSAMTQAPATDTEDKPVRAEKSSPAVASPVSAQKPFPVQKVKAGKRSTLRVLVGFAAVLVLLLPLAYLALNFIDW